MREIYGSYALMMAYTFKKPVITSNVQMFIEETDNGKTGLLFESENPSSLAEKLCCFAKMSVTQRREYSKHITYLLNTKYNWSISAEKTYDVYQKLNTAQNSNDIKKQAL